MTPPFDESAVLYRFVPTEEERSQYRGDDKGVEEIVLVRGNPPYLFSLWGKWGEYWQMSPRIETLILRLLTDLAAVEAERNSITKQIDCWFEHGVIASEHDRIRKTTTLSPYPAATTESEWWEKGYAYDSYWSQAQTGKAARDRYRVALIELEHHLLLSPASTHTEVVFRCCAVIRTALVQGKTIEEGK